MQHMLYGRKLLQKDFIIKINLEFIWKNVFMRLRLLLLIWWRSVEANKVPSRQAPGSSLLKCFLHNKERCQCINRNYSKRMITLYFSRLNKAFEAATTTTTTTTTAATTTASTTKLQSPQLKLTTTQKFPA